MQAYLIQHIGNLYRKCTPRRRVHRSAGQAIVELALALTFLAYLFAAAVDLGFAFKSYQTLVNATAEASSYLAMRPSVSCGANTTALCARQAADSIARIRFRGEQGDRLRSFGGSTLDLNGDERDDAATVPPGFANFEQFIRARVQIKAADATQVTTTNTSLGVNGNFTESPLCQERLIADIYGRQCYIVVISEMTYRPFAIAPVVGDTMTIRAISVKPIVN